MDSWNDDRLDEMSRRVDEGFKGVDRKVERVEQEMKEGFKQVDRRFENVATRESVAEITAQLGRFENRLDRLYWAFVTLAVLLVANGIIGNG